MGEIRRSGEIGQPPTVAELAAQLAELRERVEDLEDALDLEAAIARDAGQPLIPWSAVEKDLGL